MQITIRGELTLAQLRQAIYERLVELEDGYALGFSHGATLYVNPSNGRGEPVELKAKDGRKLNKILTDGPYRSAAEEYKV